MSLVLSCYKEINNVSEAPVDSIIIYNMNGGVGYVAREDYELFCKYYITANSFPKFHTMDLTLAKYHSLVLDIDFKGIFSTQDKSNYMTTILKPSLKSFFDEIPCFTFISATRPKGGLHIYLPEFALTNDDYIHFCTQLQSRMDKTYDNFSVKVDIPNNFTLATASKPNQLPYTPFNICFIEQNNEFCLPLYNSEKFLQELKKIKFKNKKSNSNSLFRKLIHYEYDQLITEVLKCMMPYAISPGIQLQKITYQTIISKESTIDYQLICNIYFNEGVQHIFKSKKLNFKGLDWFTVYNFINNQCGKIKKIETENVAISRWFKQIKSTITTQSDIFEQINQSIKDDNCYWRKNSHPLRAIMTHNDGLYFLPIFYALCKVLDKPPHEILNYFTGITLDHLVNRLKLIDERIFLDISEKFSIETILYCASLTKTGDTKTLINEKLDIIIEEMKENILHCKTKLEYEKFIDNLINRYTPLIVGLYKHSSKKTAKLMWNILSEHWQDATNETIRQHVQLVHKRIEYFLEYNKKDTTLFNKLQINEIANYLQGKANMQRKEIEMDRHKFLIKTKVGILDLLTGHTSATVPELFMSNKTIDLNFTRPEFNRFYDDKDLFNIYNLITSKKFFRKFLKYSLIDASDDFIDIVRIVSKEFGIYHENKYKYLDSILHFYCHLCKYMSFDYDMVIFMLYVISSIFIATNYYRRFFVFQGNTKNGKSKFFEMMNKIFGSYSHSIRSINLHTSKSGAGPQPELATSLHSCRFIAVEELHGKIDENFIKELTGNSQISCRNLYETNAGGIPTAKVFASTNNPPECTATDAFRDRVLAIPFTSSFSENAPSSTSQQIMNNTYKIDLSDAIVQNSFKGMFILAYCNLIRNFDRETGLIDLPKIPDVMLDFKDEYLKMTDIYAQFKQHVDVQILENTKTLYKDLVSAVRKFLISTKSHLSLESLILKRFDEEFSVYKEEITFSDYDYNIPPDENEQAEAEEAEEEEEEELLKKKIKLTTICYQNVCIRQNKFSS